MIPKNCVEPLKETLASDAVNVTEQVFDTTDTLKWAPTVPVPPGPVQLQAMTDKLNVEPLQTLGHRCPRDATRANDDKWTTSGLV